MQYFTYFCNTNKNWVKIEDLPLKKKNVSSAMVASLIMIIVYIKWPSKEYMFTQSVLNGLTPWCSSKLKADKFITSWI